MNLLDRTNVNQADAVIQDAVSRLGDHVALLHMKDFLPENTLACIYAQQTVANADMYDGLLSLAPGLGNMNYRILLDLAKRRKLPMTLENTNPDNARQARLYLEAQA